MGWLDNLENGGEFSGTTNKGFKYNGAWGGPAQNGANMPGAIGFSYARTGAPSNGKYAKKTMPSAKQGGVIDDDMGQWNHPGEITRINSNNITMKGVPYSVIGISNTGDKKLMKPGKDYKFKGTKVTEYPILQNGGNTDDVLQFHQNYVNSPKYKERLIKSKYKNVPKEIEDRKATLDDIDINYEYPSFLERVITGNNPPRGSHYDVRENELNLDYNYDIEQTNKFYPDFAKPYQREIEAHELSHAQVRPNLSTNDSSRLNEYDRHQLFDRLKPAYGSITDEHDRNTNELKADLDAYRYMLNKSGKYDTGKEDFKKEHLKGSKKTFAKDRLQRNYSDEDIIWLMNNIAYNTKSNKSSKAQNGMALSTNFGEFIPGALNLIPEELRGNTPKKDKRKSGDLVKVKSSLNDGEINYVRTSRPNDKPLKREKEVEQQASQDFVDWYSDPITKERFTKNTGLDASRLQDFIGRGQRTPMRQAEADEDISYLSQLGADAVYQSPYFKQANNDAINDKTGEILYQKQRESTFYSKAPNMRNVLGHEITHASKLDGVLGPALQRVLGDVNNQVKGTFKRDREYLDHPEETYGNFHMFRKNLGLKPGQKINEKQLQELVKEKGLDEEIFYKAYDDDKIVKAINTIALNTSGKTNTYAKNGSKLINLNQNTNFTKYKSQSTNWLDNL